MGTWGKKRLILGVEIAGKFYEDLEVRRFKPAPFGWESLWEDIHRLIESCGFKQGDDGKWYATDDLMQILDSLRDLRNIVRHAPSTLQEDQRIPEAYINSTPKIRANLLNLWRLINENSAIPQVAKVLEYSSDCYGGTEFTLALENKRVVRVRYVYDWDKDRLAYRAEESLALAQKEFEFFIFPSPRSEEHLLINPLLIRRDYIYRELGCIDLREEALNAIKVIIREIEAMPDEEGVREV